MRNGVQENLGSSKKFILFIKNRVFCLWFYYFYRLNGSWEGHFAPLLPFISATDAQLLNARRPVS